MHARTEPSLQFYLPAPELRDCVSSYYALTVGAEAIDDRLHPEWGNIRFSLDGEWTWSLEGGLTPAPASTLFGPTSRSARITGAPGARLFGIGLLPMGWATLVRVAADRFADRMAPLSELWGAKAEEMRRQFAGDGDDAARIARADALFGALLADAPAPDPLLAPVHRALVTGNIQTVQLFAAELQVSERKLERLCPGLFGFAPKPLIRRQRFLRTLDRIVHNPGAPLTALLDAGYADQSHFVREFRTFMGMAPTAYFGGERALMRLAGAERERVVGQTMQGLHGPPG